DLGIWKAEQRAGFVEPLTRGRSVELDVPYRTKDGRPLTLAIVATNIDIGGGPCTISVATDLTERPAPAAQLPESAARALARADELAVLMDAVPAAVWIATDPDCKEVTGNRAGYELLGCVDGQNLSKTANDPAVTRHFRVFLDEQEVMPHDLPLQRAARGAEVRGHAEVVRFDD